MNTWIKRSLGTTAVAGGFLLAGAAMASASDNHSHDTSGTGSSFSSPITVGGFNAGVTSQRSSSSSSATTRTDRDGPTTRDSRSSQDASKDSFGLASGGLSADPAGSLRQAQSRDSSTGDRGIDGTSDASSSASQVTGRAPVRIGGVTGTAASQRASKDASSSSTTDERGTRSTERSSQSTSRTGGTIGTGDLTANPGGSLTDNRSSSTGSDRGGLDRITRGSASGTSGSLSSPVNLGGATARTTDERADQQTSRDTVSDENGYRSDAQKTANASRSGGGLTFGSLGADPGGAAATNRSMTSGGDVGDRADQTSSSRSGLGLAAPFHGGGLAGGVNRQDATGTAKDSQVRDQNGTTVRSERQESVTRNAIGGASGPFSGNPAFGLTYTRTQQSDRELGDQRRSSTSDTRSEYAFPYSYDGFVLGGDFASANARQLTEQAGNRDGSTTSRTESSQDAQRTTPGYSFDGFSGQPRGEYSAQRTLDDLTRD